MLQLINTSAVSVGSVNIAPYDTGTMGSDYQTIAPGTYNIAAGHYTVKVFNAGLTDITVDGDIIAPGNAWLLEARANPATQRVDLTPAIEVIVPAGGSAAYSTTTPSA